MLTPSRFRYFEQRADVQMLAMMSCIFYKSISRTPTQAKWSSRSAFPPESFSRSSSYYPSIEVATSLSGASLQSSPRKLLSTNSTTSSTGASVNDQSAILLETNTPPGYMSSSTRNYRRDSQSTCLSASPEQHRHVHRSNSNLSAMAASFARPFSSTNSATSSPPNSFPKKRVSPSGSYLGATSSSITWASAGMFGKAPTIKQDPAASVSFSVSDTEDELPPAAVTNLTQISGFSTTLNNQEHFHDEGHARFALLDAKDEWRLAAYREAYSNLLYVWGLPIARCELLKYNDSAQPITNLPQFDKNVPSNDGLATESTSLAFGIHCTTCASLSSTTSSFARCPSCSRALRQLLCLFCNTYIHNLSSPCLKCGHTLHNSCRRSLTKSGLKECISGCGCICSDHPSIEMPEPETRRRVDGYVRDVSPAITVIADPNTNEQERTGWKGSEWEEMAYESLSRNLRGERRGSGRVIRERASQIWRGNPG